jgi:hypothetical protein
MMGSPILRKKKRSYLLIIGLTQAVASLGLVLLFYEVAQITTLLLVLWGIISTAIAFFIVVSASSNPLASLGVWFIVVLALQHGGGWVLQQIFGEQHYSRFVNFGDTTLAVALALSGTSLLIFSFTYSFYNFQRRKNFLNTNCAAKIRNPVIDQIPWFVIIVWLTGFVFFEFAGGMARVETFSGRIYVLYALFSYLATAMVVLIGIKLLASNFKTPIKYIAILVLWGGFVFFIGQRQYIITIFLVTLVLSLKWQVIIIKTRHIVLLILFVLSLMAGITYLREAYGRSIFFMPVSEQFTILLEEQGIGNKLPENLSYDLGYRLNAGNVLLGMVAEQTIQDFFWFEPVIYSAVKLVPGFIWTTKLYDLSAGELPRLISNHYGLPAIDYIATYVTVFYAMGGMHVLFFLSAFMGVFIAFLDLKLAESKSLLAFMLAIGLGLGLLAIDHSINILFLSLRNVLLLYVLLKLSILFGKVWTKGKNEHLFFANS